jgi:hypothetical protein
LPTKQNRSAGTRDDDARHDAKIVELSDDIAEGWELLCVLPAEALGQLRARQHRGELDKVAITELRHRYRHLLAISGGPWPPKVR